MDAPPYGVALWWLGTWVFVAPLSPPTRVADDSMERYAGAPFRGSVTPGFGWIDLAAGMPDLGPYRHQQLRLPGGEHVLVDEWRRQQRRWFTRLLGEMAARGLLILAGPVIHAMRMRNMVKLIMRRRNY